MARLKSPEAELSLRLVLFDFDYTLADSSAGAVECIDHALRQLGYPPVADDRAHRTIGLSLQETFVALAETPDLAHVPRFRELFLERAEQVMVDRTFVYPTVAGVTRALRQVGLQLGIVSTKYRRRIERILGECHLGEAFDLIIGGEDVTQEKPDPAGVQAAMHALESTPGQTLYVGDSLVDAHTAERAGVAFVAVLTGTTGAAAFNPYPVHAIIEDLQELPVLLEIP